MDSQYKRGFGSALILVTILAAWVRVAQWMQMTDVVAWATTPQFSPITVATIVLMVVTFLAAFIWMPGRAGGGLSM